MQSGWRPWRPKRRIAAPAAANASKSVRRRARSASMPARPRRGSASCLALTRGERAGGGLQKWLNACDGSARCTDACPEDINVRQWVTIAKMKALEAVAAARGGRDQRRQPLPPHGAGRAAAGQHAAAVGDPEEDPGAGRAAHRRRAVLYRLQRAAHAAHRAERHGHPRRAGARLRRRRRHRPLLRRLPVPGSRPADLRAHGPSHLPALRPVRRRARC